MDPFHANTLDQLDKIENLPEKHEVLNQTQEETENLNRSVTNSN
jgi:hypothetical protein